MMRGALVFALVAVGCSGAPGIVGMVSSHDSVVKLYAQDVQFDAPRACDVYLERRITDENARTVEYDAKINGHEASVVYSIVATDPYPLQVALYDATGMNTLTIGIADHTIEVLDGAANVVRVIDAYDGAQEDTTVRDSGQLDDSDGLTLLGCALADRKALGDVPAFLRNLASGGQVPGQPDVGQSSENAPPVLPDWKGGVSLLGAFWLASGCLGAEGWQCGCWQTMHDPVIGPVAGWCK